ncbi:ACSS3, partial [Symbiodinium necroappetens]
VAALEEDLRHPHTLSAEDVLAHFRVSLETGLTHSQVLQQRLRHGPNELAEEEKKSVWKLILAQFEDLLVRILLVSAVVSFVLAVLDEKSSEEGITAFVEPLVILLILIANAFVGVWQESNAEKALDALKRLQPDTAAVLRDGCWTTVNAAGLVPGDVVQVKVGDKVPADLRVAILNSTTIRVEQSQLTGESQSVSKDPATCLPLETIIQGKVNMLFASTTISNGACVGVVTATGMATEIGAIQDAVQLAAGEEEQTPLQQKLDDFGNLLAKVIFAICLLVWLINYKHFFDPVHGSVIRGCIYYFKIAVALAVAAIPEGLPAVITTCLALGTSEMAKKNAIVRKLPSVETLGCTSVICSDKTGTLTTNEMCCTRLVIPKSSSEMVSYVVEGHSYAPVGLVQGLSEVDWQQQGSLQAFAKIAALCNESRLEVEAGSFRRMGEPTEAALLTLVEKLGVPDPLLHGRCWQKPRDREDAMAFCKYWTSNVQKKATLEFTRDRKSMSVLCAEASGAAMLYVKGAPESILERCSSILLPNGPVELSAAGRQAIRSSFAAMASEALRTLALAQRSGSEDLLSSQLLRDPANFVQLKQPFVVQSFPQRTPAAMAVPCLRQRIARQVNVLHRPLAGFHAVRHISRERYNKLHKESIANPEGFWSHAAAAVSWSKPWSTVLDRSNPPFYRWFPGAQLNMCYNAVDRHVEAGLGGSNALIYDSPLAGVKKTFTYSELQREVSRTAGALAKLGIGKGDRVVIYMPMISEAVFAMLACARLGAPHSVVFGGFAGPELATRLEDFQPKAIIWASCGLEPKGPVEYQPMIKEALELVETTPSVRICKQRPEAAAVLDGDLDWDDALATAEEVACEQVDATDPLYMLYTSGSTGKPKGVLRDTGGYAVALKASMAQFMNMAPGEAYWAASDIGWVVGHSYIVYGPLLQGCATVLYEGKPIGTPDAGAFWRVVEEYQVRALFLAPTALRAIRRVDPDGELVRKYNLSCLRSLFVAGERSDPETPRFYASILNVGYYDNWWQTETGHPICGLQEDSVGRKDGSAGLPLFGYDVAVFDERGHIMQEPNHAGHLVVKLPLPPGTFPSLWNNDEGFLKSYLEEFPGYYNSGDSGVIDDHGYVSVLERSDDVINVAAHRLSCGQIEACIKAHPDINDCAVVGATDELKGQVPIALLVLMDATSRAKEDIVQEVKARVRHDIGAIASLAAAEVVEQLPKTRSGKVLRKNIRGMADGKLPPIPGTIENPPALDFALNGLKRMGYAKGL